MAAFDEVADLGNFGLFHFHSGGGQTVRAANFLDCVCGDGKTFARRCRTELRLLWRANGALSSASCVAIFIAHLSERAREIFATRFSIAALI